MSDYGPAVWIPTSHYWADDNAPRYVIVHGTGSSLNDTPENVAHFFQSNNPPTSTHYVVGRDGTIVQCVAEKDAAWGNGPISAGHDPWWKGNPNEYTISIEHINNGSNSAVLTDAQKAASFALISSICDRHNIPRRPADATGGITGHYSIDPVHRAYCPGNYPWTELWGYLGAGSGITAQFRPGLLQQLLGGGAAVGVVSSLSPGAGGVAASPSPAYASGFGQLAQALDDAEQTWPFDWTDWKQWPQAAGANLSAVALRGAFVLAGFLVLMLIASRLVQTQAPRLAALGRAAAEDGAEVAA